MRFWLRFNYVEPLVMLATILQWMVLASLAGLIVGVGTSAFLHALFWFTNDPVPLTLWQQMLLLPCGGFLTGLVMYYGYKLNKTGLDDSVITAVHQQAGRMPFLTLLVKPVAAIVTLASGGSAGREGPCSHIGATLASGLGRVLRLNAELRQRLVACGVSAGFAGVFGTPVAGALYGCEVLAIGRIRHDFLFPAVVSGATAFAVSNALNVPYIYYHFDMPAAFSHLLFLKATAIGLLCGLVAWLFVDSVRFSRHLFFSLRRRFDIWPPLMPMLGGTILSILILVVPTDYLGLSLPIMNQALNGEAVPFLGFFWKILLVAVTLGSGFYGGIATPQLVIGALSGNVLAGLFGVDPSLGAAVGLVAVLASASNTPIAAILMGVELFGGAAGAAYVAGAGMAAYLIIGHRSVYPDQLMAYPKSSWMRARADLPLGQESVRLSYGLAKGLARLRARHRLRRPPRRPPPPS